ADRLQYGVTEGTRLLAEIRRRGVWMREASAWRAHMRLLIDLWDQLLAALLLDDLLDRHPSDLLRDGFASHVRQPGSCCPRCGCVVIEGTASSPFVPDARHHWIECPTCGPREAWDGDGPRLRADAPARMTAGTRLEIRIDSSAPSGNRPLDGS